MRDIFSVIRVLANEFKQCIDEGYDIENAEELALDQLTEKEVEEYDTDIAPILNAWKTTCQAV